MLTHCLMHTLERLSLELDKQTAAQFVVVIPLSRAGSFNNTHLFGPSAMPARHYLSISTPDSKTRRTPAWQGDHYSHSRLARAHRTDVNRISRPGPMDLLHRTIGNPRLVKDQLTLDHSNGIPHCRFLAKRSSAVRYCGDRRDVQLWERYGN